MFFICVLVKCRVLIVLIFCLLFLISNTDCLKLMCQCCGYNVLDLLYVVYLPSITAVWHPFDLHVGHPFRLIYVYSFPDCSVV